MLFQLAGLVLVGINTRPAGTQLKTIKSLLPVIMKSKEMFGV